MYDGNPNPILCEIHENGLLVRHISYCKGSEPELYQVEICLHKELDIPDINSLAAGITKDRLFINYWICD